MGAQILIRETNKSRSDNFYGCKLGIQFGAFEEEDGPEFRNHHSRYNCRVHDERESQTCLKRYFIKICFLGIKKIKIEAIPSVTTL